MRPEAVEGSEEAAAVDEVAPEGTEGSDGAATGQAPTSVTVSNPKVEVVSDDRPVDADDVD